MGTDGGGIIDAIVDVAASQDATLSAAARELTTRAILEIDDILEHGTPAAKQQILRSFVPALIRAGEAQHTNEEMDQMREDFRQLRKEMREHTIDEKVQERDEMPEDVPTDIPPPVTDNPVPSQT